MRFSKKIGYSIDFMRKNSLADDYTPIMPVLKFVIENCKDRGLNFDQIWLFMACSLFVDPYDLIGADKLFIEARQKNLTKF